MSLLHRTLYEADDNFTITAYNCTITACSVYCLTCDDDYLTPPSPSPSPADPIPNHPNHAIPYLVSAACVLGVAFLLLTTCTILLRHRCSSRRRTSVRVASTSTSPDEDHSPVDHPVWHIVTVGLPQSVIDSITSVSYKTSDRLIGDSDCSVCLTGFEDGDGLRILPKCSHAFHLPCIDTWLRSHKNCPLCRAPVVNANANDDDSPPFALNTSSTPGSGSARIQSSESPDDNHDHDNDGNLPVESADRSGERDLSDLGEDLDEDFQPVRRSISLDSSAVIKSVVIDVGLQNGEGSSEKEKMVEEADREGHGDSGISRMMKRSLSSSAKILSPFRGSKSQSSSSTLPL